MKSKKLRYKKQSYRTRSYKNKKTKRTYRRKMCKTQRGGWGGSNMETEKKQYDMNGGWGQMVLN